MAQGRQMGPLVQCQMDMVGLAEMFFKAGAHGLKQIALAGIDVHTIGALLTLGNLVPASVECRRKLDLCRIKQRKSTSWIYKAIEIGGATNFLADELLKTRAGEGALALFTAIMPVLSENCYTDTVLNLFEHSKIEANSTPGIGQLQRLRSSVLAFSNAMNIKDKIMQYHLLFRKYSDGFQEPNHAIPRADTIAQLIQVCAKVKMTEGGYQLRYKGIQGAAWTAAYALDVLGLGVCMVVPSPEGETPVPISADFGNAQVLIYVAEKKGDIQVCRQGNVEDLITTSSVSPSQIEWNIDCDLVNYFTSHHPALTNEGLQRKISEFVAAKTLDAVAAISQELTYSVNVKRSKFDLPSSLATYQDTVLPSVQKRSLAVIQILGFCPPAWEDFVFDLKSGVPLGIGNEHVFGDDKENVHSYWQATLGPAGDLWWSDDLDLRFRRYVKYWSKRYSGADPTRLDVSSVLTTTKNAVLFASLNAFTDWDTSLRQISARFFELAVLRNGGRTVNINEINNIQMIQQFCTSQPLPEPLFWSFGQELNGVVLLRHVILSQNLFDIDGIVIRFKPGRIMFHGERCIEIAASTDLKDSSYTGFRVEHPRLRPYPQESWIKLSSTSRMAGNIVYVGVQALHNHGLAGPHSEERLLDVRSELVAEVLSNLLVSKPCPHNYYTPLSPHLKMPWKWIEGLVYSTTSPITQSGQEKVKDESENVRRDSLGEISLPPSEQCLYYQAVDGDGNHQWLACHVSSAREMIFIWQWRACLNCTIESVNGLKSINPHLSHEDVCVISGKSRDDLRA